MVWNVSNLVLLWVEFYRYQKVWNFSNYKRRFSKIYEKCKITRKRVKLRELEQNAKQEQEYKDEREQLKLALKNSM